MNETLTDLEVAITDETLLEVVGEYEVTLVIYVPYTQKVLVEAGTVDDAMEAALTDLDYSKFAPSASLEDLDVEVYDVTPDDDYDGEDEEDEE